MLHAIDQNKAGRNFNSHRGHWKEVFKTSEDSLTSSVFERLFYLPVELFWDILKKSCNGNILPESPGSLNYFEFWPHWESSFNSKNSNFVEPDLFIRFNSFDIIVESKRWDQNQQNKTQWKNEILAYKKEYEEELKEVYLIALGGINDDRADEFDKVTIVKCRWKSLLQTVKDTESILASTTSLLNSNDSITRILQDVVTAFRLHGFSTGTWFDSFNIEKLRIHNYNRHLNTFSSHNKTK